MSVRTAFRLALLAALVGPTAAPASAQQFQYQAGMIPGTPRWTEGTAAADVDNDGDLDLFFADGEGFSGPGTQRQNVLVINRLVETGSLSFVDESTTRLGVHVSHARDVFTGDVDADGWVDALFANGFNTDRPFLYMNRGPSPAGFFSEDGVARGLGSVYSSASGQFGDLDDDGDLDLILCDSGSSYLGGPGGQPHLFTNDGAGNFTEVTGAAWSPPTKVAHMDVQLADVDQDWDLDFVGINRANNAGGNHYLMLNDGAGGFTNASSTLSSTSGSVYEAEIGDLDGDSDLDLFFVSLSGFSEGVMRNDFAPSGPLSFTSLASLPLAQDDNEIVLIDFDNDDDYDALVGSLGPQERLWRNDGGLSFAASHASITSFSDATLDATAADLDNDGAYDIVTAQGEGQSSQWANKVYLNTGAADDRPPTIVAKREVAVLAPDLGPWVAHAKVRDQVLDDGDNWVSGTCRFVVGPAPASILVDITAGAFSPMALNVSTGASVIWTNSSGSAQTVTCTSFPQNFDSGAIGAGGAYENVFVTPGVYTYQSVLGGFSATVTVTGSPSEVPATYMGGQQYRFAMAGDASAPDARLAYELVFTDWAGNVTVSETCVVGKTSLGTPSCFGVGCPCGNDDALAGCATSTGAGARLTASGTTSVSADDAVFEGSDIPGFNQGLLYMGDTTVSNPLYDGLQCALGTTFRFFGSIQSSGAGGVMSYSGVVGASGGLITSGTTWHFHWWFRDFPVSPCGTGANLTHLLSVTFTP